MNNAPDKLTAGDLLAFLPSQRMANVLCLNTVDSTNKRIREMAVDGAPDGQIVIANEQSNGKGRLGRNFVSPKDKGIYLSVLLRPNMMIAAMREVIALGKLEGVDLTEEDLKGYVALIDTLSPEGMPSMRQDGVEERASEVAFFAGTVLEKAKKYGLGVPVNKALYLAIKTIEGQYRKA